MGTKLICENCGVEHKQSKRFCSIHCARSFSTKEKRKDINLKVSQKLKGRNKNLKILYDNIPFEKLSLYKKFQKVREEQKFKCLHCGRKTWLGKPILIEVDHIDGNKRNNSRENLRGLCPNCHSQTPTWKGRNKK